MKMSLSLSLFFSFFLVIHNVNGFNITQILNQYPDFSTFNSYLSQTNLAGEINSRQTITVLAVENGNLSPISGKPSQVLKKILSVHVVLDYFDIPKLQRVVNHSTTLTTLFQTSGSAGSQQGFLNATQLSPGSIAFGSAVPGSTLGSNLVKSVASRPYNISVLQVSNVIVPPGIDDGSRTPPLPSPGMSPQRSPPAPPTPPPKSSRAPVPSQAPPPDAPVANAPVADKHHSRSAGTALDISFIVVFTMLSSSLYLASRI